MKVNKTQNIAFRGTIHLKGCAKASDSILKPLIHQLKHHCGSKAVQHYIDVDDIGSMRIYSTYGLGTQDRFKSRFFIALSDGLAKTPDNVQRLIERTKGVSETFNIARKQERTVLRQQKRLKKAEIPEKETFIQKVFHFLRFKKTVKTK